MRVVNRPGVTRIVVSSASGKDVGVFLLFLALVGTAPLQYMYDALLLPKFVSVTDWSPAITASIGLVVAGLLLIFNTHKSLEVRDHLLMVRDGFWRRALRFQWKGDCVIKLRPIEQEFKHKVFEAWQIKLVSEGYEYLLDARYNQQLMSRRLAEALAKALGCSLMEREDGHEVVIEAKDLDLPFSERVRKYPQVIGSSVSMPANLHGLEHGEHNGTRFYRWGVSASWLLLEILVLTMVALLLSAVPWHGASLADLTFATNNYSFYYGVLGLLGVSMIILPGFQAQITLSPQTVSYRALIWRIPIDSDSIPMTGVEEIRQHEGIRGPLVQIISDNRIISFRISDREVARWLAFEVGRYISEKGK